MAYNEIDIDWIEQVIVPAIDMFYDTARDKDLLLRNTSERAIVPNIYCRMNKILLNIQEQSSTCLNLFIDVEYNRNYLASKRAYGKCSSCVQSDCFIKVKGFNETEMSPDVLIHHRGDNCDNQVAIEFKKKTNRTLQERESDHAKLTFLNCHKPFPGHERLNYIFRYGYFIDLGVNNYSVTPYIDSIPQPIRQRRGGQWV